MQLYHSCSIRPRLWKQKSFGLVNVDQWRGLSEETQSFCIEINMEVPIEARLDALVRKSGQWIAEQQRELAIYIE